MSNTCFAGIRKVTSHSERNSIILASSLPCSYLEVCQDHCSAVARLKSLHRWPPDTAATANELLHIVSTDFPSPEFERLFSSFDQSVAPFSAKALEELAACEDPACCAAVAADAAASVASAT